MKLSKIVIAFAMIAAASSSFAVSTDMGQADLSQYAFGDVAGYATQALIGDGYATGAGAYASNEAAIEQSGSGSVAVIDQTGITAPAVGNVAFIIQSVAATAPAVALIGQTGSNNFAMIKQ